MSTSPELSEVWIIDDDAITRMLIRRKLVKNQLAKKITEFVDGQPAWEALSALAQAKDSEALPSLILLDINMPAVGAWEFLSLMEQKPFVASLKVAIISSSIDWQDLEKSKQFPNVCGYLAKPLCLEELLALKPFQI